MTAARLREAALILREQPGATTFGNALADWLTAASVAEQHPSTRVVDFQAHAVADVILLADRSAPMCGWPEGDRCEMCTNLDRAVCHCLKPAE